MDISHLKKVPLFSNLTNDHLQTLAAIGTERAAPAGESLFKEGEVGSQLFVIISGRVRISKMVPGIGEEALAILEPGDYFGEMALIDDTPRSADAIMHTSGKLWMMQKGDLEEVMFLHKDLAYELLWTFVRTLSVRLRETNDKIKTFFALSSRF
jgi:CRP/FNR family cyclic AMP-dependent transcriptional regulator